MFSSLVCLTIAMSVVDVQSATYPDMIYSGPSPMPAFPAGFEAFGPPVEASGPVSGAPEIAEWTRGNQPGDTMALAGEDLGTDFIFYSEDATAVGILRHLEGQQAAVTLPATLPPNKAYLMWNRNAQGASRPVIVNGTEAWWLGPDRVARGATFSIFGENLNLSGACYAYIEGYGWITSTESNPYKADFVVPQNLSNGSYTVYAHNGKGGKYGWGIPLALHIYDGVQWNDDPSTWIDVTAPPYNAANDGSADVTAALESAIDDADNTDWSTVYLPAGTYAALTEIDGGTITKVRIKGDGMDQTIITELGGGLATTHALVDIAFDDSEMSDLSIQSSSSNTDFSPQLLRSEKSDNAVFKNVRISQRYPEIEFAYEVDNGIIKRGDIQDIVRGHGSTRVKWENCEFYVRKPLLMSDTPQLFFEDCRFYGLDLCNTILSVKEADGVSITGCSAENFDDSTTDSLHGWSNGRWLYSYPTYGSPRNWYVANNATIDLTQPHTVGYQNTGEDFMFERCEIRFIDNPTAASPTQVTFASLPTSSTQTGRGLGYVGYTISVMDGKGFSQSRIITDVDVASGVITVDQPWNVTPDADSLLAVSLSANRVVAYKNSFDGIPYPGEGLDKTAETGVQAYGGCVNLIADGNRSHEQDTAFYVYSNTRALANEAVNHPTPNYFNVYKNNIADTCYGLAKIMVAVPHDYDHLPSAEYPAMFGNVFRDNSVTNISDAVWRLEWNMSYPHQQMSVFERTYAVDFGDDIKYFYKPYGPTQDTRPDEIGEQAVVGALITTTASVPPPPDPPPAPVLTGISIVGYPGVDEGDSEQYVCMASYSDGSTAQVDPIWSENSPHAGIDDSGVLSTGNVDADEAVTVSASYGGYTDTHDITIRYIPVVLTGITISGPMSVTEGDTAQYSCAASYSDGTLATVSPIWSDNSSAAVISESGVLTAGNVTSDQSVTIAASFGGQTDTHALTVTYVPPVVTGIVISGASSLDEGKTEQYICTATYSDGSSAEVSPVWTENSSYTSINGSGLLSAGDVAVDQNVTVSADFDEYSASYAVTIRYVAPVLSSITISGPSSVSEEDSAQYTCTANFSDGSTAEITPVWSEDSAYASVSSSGLLTAGDVTSSQSITVSASYNGYSDTHTVVIAYIPPTVTGITISGPGEVEENSSAQYVCTATYSDGSSAAVNPTWTVDSASAAIGGSGLLSVANIPADEQATVQARFAGIVTATIVQLTAAGDQVVLELNGFDGKTVSAELWDDVTKTIVELGEEFEPEEIVIENVNPDQWYWLGLREFDATSGEWVLVHGRWIWM